MYPDTTPFVDRTPHLGCEDKEPPLGGFNAVATHFAGGLARLSRPCCFRIPVTCVIGRYIHVHILLDICIVVGRNLLNKV